MVLPCLQHLQIQLKLPLQPSQMWRPSRTKQKQLATLLQRVLLRRLLQVCPRTLLRLNHQLSLSRRRSTSSWHLAMNLLRIQTPSLLTLLIQRLQ